MTKRAFANCREASSRHSQFGARPRLTREKRGQQTLTAHSNERTRYRMYSTRARYLGSGCKVHGEFGRKKSRRRHLLTLKLYSDQIPTTASPQVP